jgi:hypothetical protein
MYVRIVMNQISLKRDTYFSAVPFLWSRFRTMRR